MCDPRLSNVFCGYTIHSVGSHTVEPEVIPVFLTNVYSLVKPSPTAQLEPGSSPKTPNTSISKTPQGREESYEANLKN